MSTERHYHFDHLLEVLKKSVLKSDFINIFLCFHACIYSPRPGADNPLVTKVLMSTERPDHFDHLWQVSE